MKIVDTYPLNGEFFSTLWVHNMTYAVVYFHIWIRLLTFSNKHSSSTYDTFRDTNIRYVNENNRNILA